MSGAKVDIRSGSVDMTRTIDASGDGSSVTRRSVPSGATSSLLPNIWSETKVLTLVASISRTMLSKALSTAAMAPVASAKTDWPMALPSLYTLSMAGLTSAKVGRSEPVS